MQRILRFFLLSMVLTVAVDTVVAQSNRWRDMHKVKKKETLYSISRDYGITLEELIQANPEMASPDYKLKKGATVFIPFQKTPAQTANPQEASQQSPATVDVRNRAIRLGVMLPLHDVDGDGKRMVEYYRGVLMACDSLKKQGISIDVFAWNASKDCDMKNILNDTNAQSCDIIIGPLYSSQVNALSEFVAKYGIMMVIPFSIEAPELYSNKNIFQIYQNPNELNESTARRFTEWFKDYHPVIVDCGDTNSTKGAFTSLLRRHLESKAIDYNLTSMSSTDENFKKAFALNKQNIVVLNTARSSDMISLFGKLSAVSAADPNIQIATFGYTEWLMYSNRQLENFYRYNVHVPSYFFTNQTSHATDHLQNLYHRNFHQQMMQSLPRFALTGFDHAYFFLKGLNKYGKTFDGAAGRFGYPAVQTPLKFERLGVGGYQNRAYLFVRYKTDHTIDLVNY
jgi:ABC-type branched-subunit amino acid transport system substrate-binding protein